MSAHAIVVENLSKKFTIGAVTAPYQTFRETLMDAFAAPARRLSQLLRGNASGASDLSEEFWALRDVSFDVAHGEVIGIIGRNGAGKSTLLKILSRITEPTRGRALLHGRVGALLEVGTGFHPELTGRENVFLNGAILGMSRRDIQRRFDEIVAFAEVERFVDTPVKHYSSGMHMRLAFAVAAHLEPEILIVDEVLAVGDAAFQKKCLGKMGDVAKAGRTVLFVSHNMAVINELCTHTIWLDKGQMHMQGKTSQVTGAYYGSGLTNTNRVTLSPQREDSPIVMRELSLVNTSENESYLFDIQKPVTLRLAYDIIQPRDTLEISVKILNSVGVIVLNTHRTHFLGKFRQAGSYVSDIVIPAVTLAPGIYFVTLMATNPMVETFQIHEPAISFEVEETRRHLALDRNIEDGQVVVPAPWCEQPVLRKEDLWRDF